MDDAALIAELRRLDAERTQGEWSAEDAGVYASGEPNRDVIVADCLCEEFQRRAGAQYYDANAVFIAAAANALPRLLMLADRAAAAHVEAYMLATALKASQAEIARLREALRDAVERLYNPFEPDNQSAAYLRARAALGEG